MVVNSNDFAPFDENYKQALELYSKGLNHSSSNAKKETSKPIIES